MRALIQHLKPSYYEDVEEQLKKIFYYLLFAPLLQIINDATAQHLVLNASIDALQDALRSGRVQYADGVFSGEFSAAISKALKKIGAKMDHRSKVFKLDPVKVPGWIFAEASNYMRKAQATHEALMRALDNLQGHVELLESKFMVDPSRSIDRIDEGFKVTAESLRISPRLSAQGREELKREYTKNMSIWIDKFSREEIQDLREKVQANAMQGYRFDRLITSIQNRFSVTENKAKFLARNETSMFLSKFREKRFADAGVQSYVWMTANDDRVRHLHQELDGKVFFYDNPPIADQRTGIRANPGGIWNCRCVDKPIVAGMKS